MISVVLPTYNRAFCISQSIESVLNQTFKDFELIIVDDNSNDNTEDIVDNFNDQRIRYFKLPINKGACYARNFGIYKANFEFVAFQDSDDIWLPEKLQIQYDALSKHISSYAMVFCSFIKKSGDKKIIVPTRNLKETTGNFFHSLIKGNFISTQTILCKKSILTDLEGFDESFPALQDWDLCLRISFEHKIYHVRSPLVVVELTPNSITKNRKKVLTAMEMLLKKHKQKLTEKELKIWQYKMGHIAKSALELEKSQEIFKKLSNFHTRLGLFAFYHLLIVSFKKANKKYIYINRRTKK